MTQLREKLAGLSPATKAAVFDLLRKQKKVGGVQDRIERRDPLAPPPLSFGQLRLWFLDRLHPGDHTYNIPSATRIRGDLHLPSLALALAAVADRHEALRTTFAATAGEEPVQVIAPRFVPRLPVVDLEALPAGLRKAEIRRLSAVESRLPFDLERGPLLRACAFRNAADEHVLLLVMHHIVSDGWSMGVLVREVAALYGAILAGLAGQPSPLPELPIQYADFAAWQRRRLSGEFLEAELAWWRGQLAGMPPAVELPADHPRRAVRGTAGAVRGFAIQSETLAALRALSRRHETTLFMTLLAVFLALLQRTTGEDDLVVGTPIAGRTRTETAPLIGFFVNTLVLRADLAGDPDLTELLRRVRETTLAAFAHQEVPFERLVAEMAPERDAGRLPLVQVMLSLTNAPAAAVNQPGLELAPVGTELGAAKFELTCTLTETEHGLAGKLDYSRDLFAGPTIERLAGHFTRLLAAAVADPRRPLAELPLLAPGERHQIVDEWNDTAAAYRHGLCLHDLVAAQAARTPDAVAASYAEESLTYRELVDRARGLGRHLNALGVAPDARVGVLLERSPEMIVGLLGVLTAGAAYVPLDPMLPPERLAVLVANAGLSIVLAQERYAHLLPGGGERTVLLDRLAPFPPLPVGREGMGEGGQGGEGNLAYVLYTSGSTGEPKGVMIPHRGIVNRLLWTQEAYGLTPADRVLQKTPFAFDVSLWEFFWPLLTGARLVFAQPEGHKDPRYLAGLIAGAGITTVHFVPSMLEAFLDTPGLEALTGLRRVIASGEALPPQLVRRFFARLPHAELHNLYGPTEASVDVSFWPCVPEPFASLVPIGRPIANHRLHVVDRTLGPQPIGVPGELLLGGPGLARGYLGRPDLTAAVFIPDPFGKAPGDRLYRTGDLVRRLPDGNLCFLGRLDHQVKIRGFRIELGEIEAVLTRLPGVREAVVLAREDAPGDKRLVAWVVPDGKAPSAADLRNALGRSLPEAMVPADFTFLESLPLTANGKVDRRALSRLAPLALRDSARFAAPQGPVEEVLAGIWAEVLGAQRLEAGRVGAHDNFFTLGGHSLLATQVISRVRDALGAELPLRALFEAPTVAELAARVGLASSTPQAPPILPVSRLGDPPLSFAQQRLWFLDRLAPDNPFYTMYGAVRLTGALDVPALRRAFHEIVRRHETLRTTFREKDGRPVEVIAPAPDFAVPAIDVDGLPEANQREELARLAGDAARRPFDLVRGPLFRAHLLRVSSREHTLLVSLHHIISDGWSMGILFHELAALYGAFARGAPSPLPALPIQYADFAVWQREWLQGDRLAAELDFWRQRLAGIPEALELPYDHPRPAAESFRGGTESFALPAALARGLVALTRRGGATPSMAMLAGFTALLGRLATREDLAIGVAIANRTRREVEGLIGFFVNTLVVRSDLSGAPGFTALLGRIRETALAAYAHQDLPFERLVEELQPERDLSRNPLVQVMFGYQNFPRTEVEVPGLVLSLPDEARVAGGTAKFDLTLFLFEDGDRLVGNLEYNRELFEAPTLRRLVGHFESLLAAAVAQPEAPLALVPLLGAAETHQLLWEWNDSASAYPATASLQDLFAAQVASAPDAPAVLWGQDDGECVLSYAELDRRSNRVARDLRARGVGPESRVGLCFERSPEMVVALLGIVKAGGAYVPLDPSYPEERLAFMVKDAGLRWLVADDTALTRLPADVVAGMEVVDLGAPHPLPPLPHALTPSRERGRTEEATEESEHMGSIPLSRGKGGRVGEGAGGEGLSYVIYTSGSTGRPKGVAVPHRAVVRLVRETNYLRLGPGDRVAQVANISFDAATYEVWGALLTGAAVVVIPREVALSPPAFAAALRERQVTSMFLTTALFNRMAREVPDAFAGLHELLFGGEAADPAAARAVLAAGPPRRLLHVYGPTESTTYASWHHVRDVPPGAASIPIGMPLANTSLSVLDRWQSPVPLGAVGELHIGGDGLARGYWQRPDLTAERFVPSAGGRLYRTGDLVRRRDDGAVEFLGRLDDQVKIRGFRVEIGEIESRLGEHPAVLHSVVLAREDVPGDRRLVAYVVQNPAYEAQESGAQSEQVAQWGEIFDDLYLDEAAESDPTFNTIGWNSTYTDLPLPRNEMEEWLEDTIGRIEALQPRRVLEIGCGTGMILFRIASRCESYTGTDVSARALAYVERHLGRLGAPGIDGSRVQLLRRSAEQLGDLEAGFDTVILNSVVQYFPSGDYLAAVIEKAVALLRPGGAIFLGDLRSLPLLPAFHASLELFHAAPDLPLARLREKVEARRRHENELAVDPAFFTALQQRLPQIARVEVHPKHGRAHNELTAFRYQVVLRVAPHPLPPLPHTLTPSRERGNPEAAQGSDDVPLSRAEGGRVGEGAGGEGLDWRAEGLTLDALRRLLAESTPAVLCLRNVPNARVAEAVTAARLLDEKVEGTETAGDLCRRANEAVAGAVEPQDLWDLSRELPYDVELSWASPGSEGTLEVTLRRTGDGETIAVGGGAPLPLGAEGWGTRGGGDGGGGPFTNNPLQGRFARRIVPDLRAFLKERVPDFMVPSAFVLLDALPLTPNGKVDRRRLPAPDGARPESGWSLVAPRNAAEDRLLAIWKELLGVDRIGVEDDFFALGGHSLLATQAISRVREAFGVELPLRAFFAGPSVAAVAREVADLRLRAVGAPMGPILPVARDGALPLSFAQERLWFLDRLEARPLAYNESAAFRLLGRLDVAALRWSLGELLRRHESLRTTFPEVDGRPAQVIQPPAPFAMAAADLSGLPAAAREEEGRRLALRMALRPFDLAQGPLVRGLLMRLAEREHAVLFSFHHIVFDGWSTGIFVRELSALYRARLAGESSPLAALPIQYADFAAWQRRWLGGDVLERQLAYWRQRLTGVAVLALPTDRPRPILPQAPAGQRFAAVPPAVTQRLRAWSRDRRATLFMTLLAAFQALLHRTTGQDDVAVGSPIANRDQRDVEPLIGFFVNMLVLRTDVGGDPPFEELLGRVRRTALGAFDNQSLPFAKLVEELRPNRDLRHTPLFQVSFQLLNVPASSLDLPGLALHPFPFTSRAAKFDLDLSLTEGAEHLGGVLDFNADLFDSATMNRLLAHFDTLLAGALEAPGRRLSDLPLLTPAEHCQLVVEWNDTAAEPRRSGGLCLHHLIADQAERNGEAAAVVCGEQSLTFGELGRRSRGLALRLRALSVGPETPVVLFFDRSPEAVVAMLGVLIAGGAYVPVDPVYPAARVAWLLEDCRAPVVVTTAALAGRLPAGTPVLLVEEPHPPAPPLPSPSRPPGEGGMARSDHPAYVIYTSGSTGRPKGVVVRHGAVMNLAWALRETVYGGDRGPLRVGVNASFSFDGSVKQIVQLAWGHTLYVLPQDVRLDPAALVDTVRRHRLDVLDCTPSQLRPLLDAGLGEGDAAPSLVLVGGEAVDADLRDAALARTRTRFWNVYGPTECTVDTAAAPFTAGALPSRIGRPLPNVRVHVVAVAGGVAPVGVLGELHVGGAGLARGYLGRPDLTAERFVPDAWSGIASGRLYRTGDLVRRLPDGSLDFLGRLDHQVKVRGFRIELGEIESALAALPGAREAAVVVREDTPGDRRLVAYVTGDVADAGVDALRRQLGERLPEPMVPAAIVLLPALPLTASGKVDRKSLPAPDRGPTPGLVAPRTAVEEILAEIWADLLGLDRVGVHDNFFERGGHSLLAVLLMARIAKRLGRDLPVAALFATPTVEALAALVAQPAGRRGSAPLSPLVAIQPLGNGVPFFCVHPIGGNVLCYLDLARHLGPDQPFYALQAVEPHPQTIEEMAARYIGEMRRVRPEGPYRLGGWSMGGLVAFEMARQLARDGSPPDLVALIDTLPPAAGLPPPTDDELAAWFAHDLAHLVGPEAAGLPSIELLFATYAANLRASRSYTPEPYSGSLVLWLSEQTAGGHASRLDGWSRLALGGTERRILPGDHYSLLRQPHVERLAQDITARLAAVS